MKRSFKDLIRIIILLFIVGNAGYGATIISVSTSEAEFSGGNEIQWSGSNNYIKEVVVIRASPKENFSVVIPEGSLMRGWHTAGERNEYQEFDQRIIAENTGITFSYGGSLNVRGYDNSNYNVRNKGTSGSTISMKLQSKKESADKPTYYGARTISVAGSVPDGRYLITTTMSIDQKVDIQTGVIVIKSLPTINIEDIDFGYHIAGENIGITERTPISIRGGTAGERFILSIKGGSGSEGAALGEGGYILKLKNPNSNEEIPVRISIVGIKANSTLEPGGNANATLEANINTILPTTCGTYSGKAKVVFQYD